MKYFKLKFLLIFAALAMAIPPAWAETSTLEFKKKCGGTGVADDGATWTITSDAAESTFDDVRGIHYGTNSATVTYVQLSTSSINGTITNIDVKACDVTGNGTLSVKVGNSDFVCSGSTSTPLAIASTSYNFTGSSSGEIVVKIERPNAQKKGIYVHSVVVTYNTGGETPQLEDVTLSFPQENYTATIGQDFVEPTLSVNPTTAASEVVYSSSNTNVATVDATTGAVTLVSTGTTTITASISNSETYKNATATYTLTVAPDMSNTAILDFTRTDYWNPELPTSKTVPENSYNDGTYTVKIAGSSGNGYYWTNNYLLMGKQGAYLQLPAFNRAVTKIDVEGTNTASENVTQNFFVGNEEVSTETLGKGDHSYDIAQAYQAAGNIYTLKVTNGYNTQLKRIIIHFDENASEVPVITVTPSSVAITDATGDDKSGTISATVNPAGTVDATATEGWGATSSSVTYQGNALHAEGTATFSSEGATDVTASLEYNYAGPLYILGTVNNGTWAPNNYVAMTRGNDGIYTARVTTNAGNEGMSWISFTKRVANDNDNGAWNYIAPYRFVPYSENVNTAWWLTDGTVNQFNALDFNTEHVDGQPVRMAPGTYDITINANDNTFKIEPYIVTVETPTFNPEAGSYKAFQSVTISCATEGATIHYTTDGSEPTESSPVYGDPIAVESTTTIKAIATMNGMANSAVAEATYTLPQSVANIAAANALTENPNFLFTGDAVVTYVGQSAINSNYHYIFIRDKGAQNGGGVIYYNTNNNASVPSVQTTNVLKRGWYAQLRPYHNWKEFQYAENVEASGETASAAPFNRTGMELKYDDNVNEYIKIDNVTYNDGNITYAGQNREDVTYTYKVVNHFNVALEDGKHYNIEGVVTRNYNAIEFYPTAATIAKQAPELEFNPASVTVYEGVQDFPEPELTAPEGVTVQNYTSSNPNVVTVDNEGKVTIVGVGTAVITATTAENDYYLSGTVTYNVEIKAKEAAGLSFGVTEPVTATYGDGNNFDEPELTFPAGLTVTYSCEPETVATVDSATGEVTIIGAGTATVTATTEGDESHNGGSASYTINVAKAEATLSFAKNSIEATYGGEVPANALTNEAGLTVTYESSDETIATVDNEGKVTIVKAGEVTITATGAANDNYNEATARYTLTIAKAEATMSFAPNAFTIVEGQEFTAPTLTNEAGLAVTYSSSNEAVATVDTNSGEVTIVGVGSTTITATGAENDNYKGATATYTITIEAKPVVATPTFTPAAGYYNSAQNVTIACETTGADIYYTTDGTVPTTESTKFAETITVGENLTIKAIAVKEGYTNSDIAEAEYVIDIPVQIAALTFMPGSGHYTEAKEVSIACATPGVTITYKIGDGEFQPYTKPFVVDHSCTVTAKATKDGRAVWTDSEASATYTINKLNPLGITDGYYQIKNNGNNKYANVQGRKTMTFTNDIDQQAGTVIRVQTKDNGQVQVLRSQAADLQGYADRAMRYVPEVVQMIANKLHAEGTGEILGNDGLDAIMEKFNESFDYHLYVEGDLNNARIYGKTPSMQPVVDFYNENQAKVDAKLPMLEDFINDAIQKVLNKTNNHGASILVPFSVDTIWNRMGGTLIRPVDAESTMAFYHQVLTNKQYVWDFAYQTATFYLEKVKAHPKYQEMQSEFGEYTQYIDKLEQIRPDMKYFIVQNNGKVDYISEGNVDIINNAPRTYWNVEPRSEFKVNFPAANEYGGNYVTTLYTDFAYDVPEEITAYKVSEVNENGNAVLTALKGTIPAQTPVLLVADTVGVNTLTLNIAPSALADTTGNQLHGPDYLINKYKINTPEVESVFNFAKETFGQTFYDNYVAQYEHLMLKSAGTVNNRYFWGLTDDDLTQCTYVNENNENDCVTRTLSMGDQQLGFYSNWEAKTNQAFLVSEQFNPIKLSLLRDVNRDGKVSIADVAAQIDILLALPEKPYLDRYDYDAADFNEDGTIKIDDVAGLISYLLSH